MKHSLGTRVTLALLTLALGACAFEPGSPASRLADAMRRWDEAGLRSYELTVNRVCFCPQANIPVRVRVEDGLVVSRTVVATGAPIQDDLAPWYPDVPGLFVEIQRAYAQADDVRVRFDGETGVPISLEVDYSRQAIDDEVRWTTEGLKPL
ncbi:MAG: hypothetical protein KF785_12995 [Gemmatimonadales bacterium]|mgnify:CR=1 FL=1|nr:hypothetical protein [Gemmatimonadales bacterium]